MAIARSAKSRACACREPTCFPGRPCAERAGEPAFAQTAGPGDEQIAAFGDPVAGGEFEEQSAVEPAWVLVIDIFDGGGMTQARGSGARFELFLPTQRQFIFEQQPSLFGVIEAARLYFVFEFLKTLREAMKTKRVQLFECRMASMSISFQCNSRAT